MENFDELKQRAGKRKEDGSWDFNYEWKSLPLFVGLPLLVAGIPFVRSGNISLEVLFPYFLFILPGVTLIALTVRSYIFEFRQQQQILVDEIESLKQKHSEINEPDSSLD